MVPRIVGWVYSRIYVLFSGQLSEAATAATAV